MVEPFVGRPDRLEFRLVAVGFEPAERLGPQRDDVMPGPEASQELEEKRPESLLHRLRVGLVPRWLEGNGVGEQGMA